jgi:hypothetical protein
MVAAKAWRRASVILLAAGTAVALAGCSPSTEAQKDAAWDAMYGCFSNYAESFTGDPVHLLNLPDGTLVSLSKCATASMKDAAPDWACDGEGCWVDGSGFLWGAVAIRHRCNTPSYGDDCSKPEYQR